MTVHDDTAEKDKRLAALDAQRLQVLADPKHDFAALRDISLASVNAQAQKNYALGKSPLST